MSAVVNHSRNNSLSLVVHLGQEYVQLADHHQHDNPRNHGVHGVCSDVCGFWLSLCWLS